MQHGARFVFCEMRAMQHGTCFFAAGAFPCSVALVFRFAGALPCCVALVFAMSDWMVKNEAGWVGFRVRGSQVVMPLARLARFARRYVLDKALCSSRALRAI